MKNNKSEEYGKDYMKIKLISDDDLPLNKQLIFLKYYPQFFLDECLYEL